VGQDYAPYGAGSFISGQVFNQDGNMLTFAGYTSRLPQLKYTVNDFSFALTEPQNIKGNATTQTPQVQAAYNTMMNGLGLNVAGVYQSYTLAEGNNPGEGDTLSAYGALVNIRLTRDLLGPVYFNVGGSYSQNPGIFGQADYAGLSLDPDLNLSKGKVVEDTTAMTGLAVLGTSVNDIGLETGFGYAQSDNDSWKTEDEEMAAYLHANIPLIDSGNAFIVPEVGYYDHMDNQDGKDGGTEIYGGLKTQINF
jgi:hypothetical protein